MSFVSVGCFKVDDFDWGGSFYDLVCRNRLEFYVENGALYRIRVYGLNESHLLLAIDVEIDRGVITCV